MQARSKATLATSFALLRWLTDPGVDIPDESRPILLAELLSSPFAVVMGGISGLMVTLIGVTRHGQSAFTLLAGCECLILAGRCVVLHAIKRTRDRGDVPTIDRAVLFSIAWCALQGSIGFVSMRSGDPILMILSAVLIMGVIGPICARNYAAPRLAMLLVGLCDLPFMMGGATSGDVWLLVLVPMTPPFLLGSAQVVIRFNRVIVGSLAGEHEQRRLASHDPLTGLLNRQGLDTALAEIIKSVPYFALLCIDLDGFKAVNDGHGHAAGDQLLELFSSRLSHQIRPDDLVARLGGDEFLVVLRHARPAEVTHLAERLVQSICGSPFELNDGVSLRIGASLGYACAPDDATTISELRMLADRALYAAKHAGRGVTRHCKALALAS